MEDLREDLEDISLDDNDLGDLGEDLNDDDMSVEENNENESSGGKQGKKKKFPIFAVVGLVVVLIGVAILGLMLGKKKNSKNKVVVEETVEYEMPALDETKETKQTVQSADEILARVRGENKDAYVDITGEEETTEALITDSSENDESEEALSSRDTRIEEIENDNGDKYSVIVEKKKINYKDVEYSTDIEATYTITRFKEKQKEIFYTEQGDEHFKVDRVDIVAEGSISGLTGTWELTLPYSTEWKLGDMITVSYKMGEVDDSSRAIIDLKVKDYSKITVDIGVNKNNTQKKAVIPQY